MAKTDLTNQRQVFVDEYVHSEDHLKADKKFFFARYLSLKTS